MISIIMGNEGSQLNGLVIEEKAVEVTEFWTQYQATIRDSCRYFSLKSDGSVSVFRGEVALGALWAISTPLEKFSNNLLKFRHPCIVRYISAWQQRSTLHLATEFVLPLAQVLKSQTPQQICIGLNNILRALVFLHEQAGMSHNNICVSAIYVTGDGQWKLGGLQYLCSFNELTSAFLKQARIHRYDKAVDVNEDSYDLTAKVDQYAFAVLVEDVFKGHQDDEVPHLREFKEYCIHSLQNPNPENRPNLSEVLLHDFFSHEFISIYKFLNFLPLKNEEERCKFFSNILMTLKCYDEETVAKQLGGLLLSRLTLLDQTARRDVIPFILKPKNERSPQNEENFGFFSLSIFKEHVKPRLLQLFGVRDSQIRMLLLNHFSKFVHVFSHEELSQHILPELLVGIKDVDDNLVASTLICLSSLVPILGADTVIGGKRSKLFTDGRPNLKSNPEKPQDHHIYSTTKPLQNLPCSEEIFHHNDILCPPYQKSIALDERPTPVGGESVEDENIISNNEKRLNGDSDDDWSDWENNNRKLTLLESVNQSEVSKDSDIVESQHISSAIQDIELKNVDNLPDPKVDSISRTALLQNAAFKAKKNIVDISELDIKNQKNDTSRKTVDEFDFFADMTPIIEKPAFVNNSLTEPPQSLSSKLDFVPDDALDENDGWGDNWEE